jgi:hypothetical protein
MKSKKKYVGLAVSLLLCAACENQKQEFPDFDYQTVYFANQLAMRTVELGEDEYVDNSMDNQHKVMINAVMGGAYANTQKRTIDVIVDTSLCSNLYFKGTATPVLPMPESHYQLAAGRIEIAPGNIQGGVEVQLTDAFFEDEKTLRSAYVIPLVMTGVQGADSILKGKAYAENPDRFTASEWSILPKDYVLYGLKYVNPWHGVYLRRGTDVVTLPGSSPQTVSRHTQYVENGEVVSINTAALKKATLQLTTKNESGENVSYSLLLEFADDETCAVKSASTACSITGTGKFVAKGEKNSLGGKDRNAIYLDYTVEFTNPTMHYDTRDTLVLRERGVYGAGIFEVEKQ